MLAYLFKRYNWSGQNDFLSINLVVVERIWNLYETKNVEDEGNLFLGFPAYIHTRL